MEAASDLLVPHSEGALLAEEWSINPLSVLPSFLEMNLIDDASKSGNSALRHVFDVIVQRLIEYGETNLVRIRQRPRTSGGDDPARTSSVIRMWSVFLVRRLAKLLQRYTSEVRCLVIYLLERQCLRASSSTVAESIYGAKRAVVSEEAVQPGSRKLRSLDSNHATRLALVLAIAPYAREKLDIFLKQCERISPDYRNRIQRTFAGLYPFIIRALDASDLFCRWRFLLGRSFFFDLKSLCLGQIVRRVTLEDNGAIQPVASMSSMPDTNKLNASLQKSVLYLLTASIAFSWLTQIRATWHNYQRHLELRQQQTSEEDARNEDLEVRRTQRLGSTRGQVPPPPHSLVADLGENEESRRICPLCRRLRMQPAASISGYVFCFPCLSAFVKEHGTCPVTGRDCPESRIIRLFEPHHTGRNEDD